MARDNPMLSQAEIARALGLSRQGVSYALKSANLTVRNARGEHMGYRRGRAAHESAVADARQKLDTGLSLSRAERHALWQEYRRREREAMSA